HRRAETREPLEREDAVALEVFDEDLLHRAPPIHELVQGEVLGLEAKVAARAVVAVRILQDGVTAAAASPQIGALDAGQRRRHERRVIEPLGRALPDVEHYPPPTDPPQRAP